LLVFHRPYSDLFIGSNKALPGCSDVIIFGSMEIL